MTDKLEKAFEEVILFFNRDGDLTKDELENFEGTARRVAKLWRETTITKTEIKRRLEEIIAVSFPTETSLPPMITQGPITINSWCPHHLLPVEYSCFASYIPDQGGKVLGLSKIARISQTLGMRPVLQETLAKDIADVLYCTETRDFKGGKFPGIKSAGSGVVLTGKHHCMNCRGVHSSALTTTTEVRGIYCEPDMENKMYQAINHSMNVKL